MNLISTCIIWIWLIGISFVVPTSLPAGGSQKSMIKHRENNVESPVIALKDFNLLSSAYPQSSILTRVQAGTPVSILKVWDSTDNGTWLLVNVLSQRFSQLFYTKGWVNIRTS